MLASVIRTASSGVKVNNHNLIDEIKQTALAYHELR